jgi:hypothetical protein
VNEPSLNGSSGDSEKVGVQISRLTFGTLLKLMAMGLVMMWRRSS